MCNTDKRWWETCRVSKVIVYIHVITTRTWSQELKYVFVSWHWSWDQRRCGTWKNWSDDVHRNRTWSSSWYSVSQKPFQTNTLKTHLKQMLFIVCYICVVSFRELCYELRKPQCGDPEYSIKFTISKKGIWLFVFNRDMYRYLHRVIFTLWYIFSDKLLNIFTI